MLKSAMLITLKTLPHLSVNARIIRMSISPFKISITGFVDGCVGVGWGGGGMPRAGGGGGGLRSDRSAGGWSQSWSQLMGGG